jgi:hypothetical protein
VAKVRRFVILELQNAEEQTVVNGPPRTSRDDWQYNFDYAKIVNKISAVSYRMAKEE